MRPTDAAQRQPKADAAEGQFHTQAADVAQPPARAAIQRWGVTPPRCEWFQHPTHVFVGYQRLKTRSPM